MLPRFGAREGVGSGLDEEKGSGDGGGDKTRPLSPTDGERSRLARCDVRREAV